MRIKRFLAASLQEAKEQIVRELGEDAVVLSSRQVKKGGIWGWLGFSQVEVTAAIDTQPAEPLVSATLAPTPVPNKMLPGNEALVPPWESLQQDLVETKKLLETMSKRLQTTQGQSPYPEALAAYYANLQGTGLADDLLAELCEQLMVQLTPEDLKREHLIEQLGSKLLASRIVPFSSAKQPTAKQQVVCLIGPTGVGKTTTIAKLAANAVLRRKQQVALVTFDTYRIAAVDQLRTYGEILGAPVEVVLTPGDMRQTLDKLKDYDVVFVDSVGRSQQNMMQLSELKAFLEAVRADEVYLTISSTTQYEVMREVVENYQAAKPTALIFTKLDEARRLGPVMNLLLTTGLPVAYLTNGQDVPDDLVQLVPEELIQFLLGERQA